MLREMEVINNLSQFQFFLAIVQERALRAATMLLIRETFIFMYRNTCYDFGLNRFWWPHLGKRVMMHGYCFGLPQNAGRSCSFAFILFFLLDIGLSDMTLGELL